MEIPVQDKVDSGPLFFAQEVEIPAIGLVCSVFKQQEKDVYKVSTGCAVAHNLVLTSSAVIKHGNCSPATTFLLRSSEYKNAMTPPKIEESSSHKKIQLGLAKDFQGFALLQLPQGTCHPSAFETDHVTIGDIFKKQSFVQDIKVFGYNIAESIHSALIYEEKKGPLEHKNEEILKVMNEGSSVLQFLFGIKAANLIGSPVTANGKVFAIVTGESQIQLISEDLYKFVEKSSLKDKGQ